MADRNILKVAVAEERVVLTNDRDFGELIFRLRQAHAGVIYLRLSRFALEAIVNALVRVLTEHAHQLGQLPVVNDRSVRIRRT